MQTITGAAGRGSKLRVFVVDKDTGKPRGNVPIGVRGDLSAESSQKDASTPTREVSLGLLQSDHVGYVSFDLPADQIRDLTHVWVYPLAEPSTAIDALPSLKFNSDVALIPLRLSNAIPAVPQRLYPAISNPDPVDREISPRSFSSRPELMLGKGDCESLFLSDIADRNFRFSQIVLNPKFPPSRLIELRADDIGQWPMFYRRGALLEYEMQWIPLGHALGEIVYSLPLAPCESVNVAVVEWTRQESASRAEETVLREELLHNQRRDRVIEETVAATLREWQHGSSFMAGLSIAGPIGGGLMGALGLGGSHATTSGNRNLNADTVQRLSDGVAQATTSVRSMFTTVVLQASQTERDIVQTRTVTNHNHCHALTVLYYEVLRQYRVVTRAVGGTDVVLIQMPTPDFTRESALCFRPYLEPVLLDQRLRQCFDLLDPVTYVRAAQTDDVIQNFVIEITTGAEGGDPDLFLQVKLDDGTIQRVGSMLDEGKANEFESGATNTYVRAGQGLSLKRIVAVGLWCNNPIEIGIAPFTPANPAPAGWSLQGIKVQCALSGGSGLRTLYQNPDINRHFKDRGDWWGEIEAPKQTETDLALIQQQNEEACRARLIKHLNCNKMHYYRVLWMLKDPGDYAVEFHRFTLVPNGESLLDLVDLRPVAVIGDYVAFPVGTSDFADEFPIDKDITQRFLSLPTRGVFAEAKLAHCSACEEKDITRFWDWQESPCPEKAPEISPVSLGSRARDIGTTPTPLPSPVVNIVNPAAAPDPTGMAAAMALLGKADVFRDMSGQKEVGALLQRLADGTISMAEAKEAAKHAQGQNSQQGSATSTPSQQGGADKPKSPSEKFDELQVLRNAKEHGELSDTQESTAARVLFSGKPTQVAAYSETAQSETSIPAQPSLIRLYGDAEGRAFDPSIPGTSTYLSASLDPSVTQPPSGVRFEWSAARPAAVAFDSPNTAFTDVKPLEPGLTDVTVRVRENTATGVTLDTLTTQLCVPQFVAIDEELQGGTVSPLDQFFDKFIKDARLDILSNAYTVVFNLLSTVNIRTAWRLDPHPESLPPQFTTASGTEKFMTVTFCRTNPSRHNVTGIASTRGGNGNYGAMIEICVANFDDPEATDVSDSTRMMLTKLKNAYQGNLDREIIGRLVGYTVSREILRAVLAHDVSPTGFNDPPIYGDILNPLITPQSIGLDVKVWDKFPDHSDSYDLLPREQMHHLTPRNQDLINHRLPVPPAFK